MAYHDDEEKEVSTVSEEALGAVLDEDAELDVDEAVAPEALLDDEKAWE